MFGILGIVGIAVVVLVGAGQVARRRLRSRHRMPGRLVDIGGYGLHVEEHGSGPTVVLEGGMGVPGLAWRPIVEELATSARVITYDRAGLGWSDSSPRPRTADVMADELAALLARIEAPGPYVLVGHSLGGAIARVFAHRHPGSVAGLVLLDGAHEDQFRRAPAPIAAMADRMGRVMSVALRGLGGLVRAGVIALRPTLVPAVASLPADITATIRAIAASDPKVVRAMRDELRGIHAGNDAVRALGIASFGDLPIRVISHGRPDPLPPQIPPQVAEANEALWQELQALQAASSTRGRRVVAEGIGHDLPGEAPRLVVEAVRDLLDDAVRAAA
jgi:pimeloyl-ACP methyl ester carboxylesterase